MKLMHVAGRETGRIRRTEGAKHQDKDQGRTVRLCGFLLGYCARGWARLQWMLELELGRGAMEWEMWRLWKEWACMCAKRRMMDLAYAEIVHGIQEVARLVRGLYQEHNGLRSQKDSI